MMEVSTSLTCMQLVGVSCGVLGFVWVLKQVNWWRFEVPLGAKRLRLPPGDLGWPFIGNMISFLMAFKSNNPDSFISTFTNRFGGVGLYKVVMFNNPSIIVTTAEACRKVLTHDEDFKNGWPSSAKKLLGRKAFMNISNDEHKRLRKLTAAPVNGHEALSMYLPYIEDNVIAALDMWSTMGEIEFLTQVRRLIFKITMHIFLSSESEQVAESLEKEYSIINHGIRSMAINLPGFAFYNAIKARERLTSILQRVISSRRAQRVKILVEQKKDMLDLLLETKDEKGRRLDDEEIIDVLVTYLNAGHESSGHISMWAVLYIQDNPEIMKRAKAEQEEIVKSRPLSQQGLIYSEIRRMKYLSKVIDETLRLVTFSSMVFREATKDVNIGDYLIPKGWKVVVWFRSVHHNPNLYSEPMKFDPQRWDNFIAKAGTFLPFGAGSQSCPGNDLAKLEISILLHYFVLNYEFQQKNVAGPIKYLPHARPKDNCLGRIKSLQFMGSQKGKMN